MTQGAGQGPEVRTPTVRDFRVPAYVHTEADDAVTGHPSDLTGVGIPALIDHLAGLGHRTLLHIAGPGNWSASRNRILAFEAGVERAGLASAGILAGDWSAKSGYEAVGSLPGVPATAILAANDQMALGVMLALKERGLRVPEDVSVVGLSILSGSHLELVPQTMRLLRERRGGEVPVVVGGIIPPEDRARLLASGVKRVYTPKDFEIGAIMSDIVDVVRASNGLG